MSSRMGADKVFLDIDGETFLERIFRNAVFVFDKIIISTNTEEHKTRIESLGLDTQVVVDKYQGCGPMGGILSVFEECELDKFAVIPVDVPFADMKVLSAMYEIASSEKEAFFLETEKGIEPLIGVYTRSCAEAFRDAIAEGDYKIRKVLQDVQIVSSDELKKRPELAVTDFEKSFKNINSKEDYLRLYD